MGQYYVPVLVREELNAEGIQSFVVSVYEPHDFDNGMKLMEHSYVQNNLVDSICSALKTPQRVAWIGDYSKDVEDEERKYNRNFIVYKDLFDKMLYPIAHRGWFSDIPYNYTVEKVLPDKENPVQAFDFEKEQYIINLSHNCYIDMLEYCRQKEVQNSGGMKGYIVHPLPLLTSVGNGEGGGDYYGKLGHGFVGTWAFDTIVISETKPDNMVKWDFIFREDD